jgi:selenocysteine lyase/cysteine desulfurase
MVPFSQNSLFDIPSEIAYFNCSYMGPQLNASRKSLINGVNMKSNPWTWPVGQFFDEAEQIRVICSTLFGGKNDNYAVVPSASYGLSTAARAIEPTLSKGDQILILSEDFPSNVLTWRRVCKEMGAEILTLNKEVDIDWTTTILKNISVKTKVVSIPSCHWTNGEIIDLEKIGKKCKELEIIYVVDTTQTMGAMPHAIETMFVDFLVSSGYKWLLCPYGFSILYVHAKWFNARPLEETWLGREHAENFAGLVNYNDNYQIGARKFEMGEKGMPTILPGAIAALEQIKEWGIENISNSLGAINNELTSFFLNYGFQPIRTENRVPHILGINLGMNNKNYVAAFKENNVYISQRGNSLRIAPHLHITQNNIEKLKNEVMKLKV